MSSRIKPFEHPDQVHEHVVQIQHLGRQQLLPTESQQLISQACSAFGGVADAFHIRRQRMAGPANDARSIRCSDDAREQVVEIVRYAARQTAIASIFWAWRSCSSRRLRSLMSRAMPWTPTGFPCRSISRLLTSKVRRWPFLG